MKPIEPPVSTSRPAQVEEEPVNRFDYFPPQTKDEFEAEESYYANLPKVVFAKPLSFIKSISSNLRGHWQAMKIAMRAESQLVELERRQSINRHSESLDILKKHFLELSDLESDIPESMLAPLKKRCTPLLQADLVKELQTEVGRLQKQQLTCSEIERGKLSQKIRNINQIVSGFFASNRMGQFEALAGSPSKPSQNKTEELVEVAQRRAEEMNANLARANPSSRVTTQHVPSSRSGASTPRPQ